jgi:plastocyanin
MPRLRARSAAVALVLAALAAASAGCGDRPPSAEVRDGRAAVALDDFFLDPQVLHARHGRVTIALANRGRLPHNFRLERNGREVMRASALKPGERDSVSGRLSRGEYRMFCSIGNHEELGVRGTVVVR